MDSASGPEGRPGSTPDPVEGADDDPTGELSRPDPHPTGLGEIDGDSPALHVRVFGSHQFFRLWLAQVVSALGDWLGFLAIAILATQVGANPDAAVAVVMSARILPGFFLAPVAGVLVDRWDRRRVMVTCDLVRAGTLAFLPFVDSLSGLVAASLILEVCTLLWAPAKEASVPNLVPEERLTSANSLSLAAAYGTFPVASVVFALLGAASGSLAEIESLEFFRLDREGALAFYADTATFLLSAVMISTLHLPNRSRADKERARGRRLDWTGTFHELKEGWQYIFINPTVRAANLGMAVALIGGGMLVPLGPVFSEEVLGSGAAGFGALLSALGFGGAFGVIGINAIQRRLRKAGAFTFCLFGAGACLAAAATVSVTTWSAAFVFGLGAFAGSIYVLGFTLLHENVRDDLRGRTFGALFTMVRLCILIAFVIGPFLSAFLGRLSDSLVDGQIEIGATTMPVPGVRLTLWFAGLIIALAGVIALHSIRSAQRRDASHPSRAPDSAGPPV